jgi:uncharacterized membrane protein YecN with MAPEG domain
MDGTTLPVTLMAAGGSALIAFWLALRTGSVRRAAKVSIGDGGDMKLIARMRAQANFTEYTPFILILIALIELTAGTSTWLWIAGALLLIARVAHGLGMDGLRGARTFGTATTFLLLVGLGLYALAIPLLAAHHAPKTIELTPLPAQG